jgi:hypothetical protein
MMYRSILLLLVSCPAAAHAAEALDLGDRTVSFRTFGENGGESEEAAVIEVASVRSDGAGHTLMAPRLVAGGRRYHLRGSQNEMETFDFLCAAYDPAFPVASEYEVIGLLGALWRRVSEDQIVGTVSEHGLSLSTYTLQTPIQDAVASFRCATERDTVSF